MSYLSTVKVRFARKAPESGAVEVREFTASIEPCMGVAEFCQRVESMLAPPGYGWKLVYCELLPQGADSRLPGGRTVLLG